MTAKHDSSLSRYALSAGGLYVPADVGLVVVQSLVVEPPPEPVLPAAETAMKRAGALNVRRSS